MFNLKHKKLFLSLFLILVISSLGVFVFSARPAHADLFGIDIGFDILAWIITRIGAIIHSFVSILFWLSGMILEMTFGIEKFTKSGFVQTGWTITRDLANMFFVLVLLAIAFATILRVETYGMKQILWKLIVAALLINFSLVIAGVVIDFSQILTNFFYEEIKGSSGVGAQIASVFNIQQVPKLNPDANAAEKIAEGVAGVIMLAFSIFFGTILILAASLALLLGAFFLIIRMIMIWILLILAPLAWFFWIIPGTSHLFKQWWNTFLKWTFFAPIYMFFVYLAIQAGQAGKFSNIVSTEMENIVNASGFKETLFVALASTPSALMQFIVIIGVLFGGLIAAQKMSVYGANGAINFSKSIGRSAGKGTWRGTKATAGGAAGLARKVPILGKAFPETNKIKSWAMKKAEKTPVLGRAIGGPGKYASDQAEKIKEERKKISERTTDDLNIMANQGTYTQEDRIRKAAAIAELAKKGGFKDSGSKAQEKIDFLKKMHGDASEITKYRPDLAPLMGFTDKDDKNKKLSKDEAISKVVSGVKPKDMENLQEKYINDDVMKAIEKELMDKGKWKKNHLEKMAEDNADLFIKVKKEIIDKKKGSFRADIEKYLDSTAGKALFGDVKNQPKQGAPFSTA